MQRKLTIFLAAALLAALSGTAAARDRVNFSLSIGVPGYAYAPPPVYYYQPQAYYAPPPVYYAPPRVYYAPPPVYYAPGGFRGHDGWNRHDRHWDRRR